MPHNLYTTIGDPKIDHTSILVIIRGERRANLDAGYKDDMSQEPSPRDTGLYCMV